MVQTTRKQRGVQRKATMQTKQARTWTQVQISRPARTHKHTRNILGHGLSVLRELDPDLYKQCIHGTSLAGGADGCCIPARA